MDTASLYGTEASESDTQKEISKKFEPFLIVC